MYFCIIVSDYYNIPIHHFGVSLGGAEGRVRPFRALFKESITLLQLETLPFIFMFFKTCYLPKVLLIGCIVPHGYLLVDENYPKLKRLKNLSDRMLVCSRWFNEKKRTKVLPFLVTFYHLGVTQMVWHTQ